MNKSLRLGHAAMVLVMAAGIPLVSHQAFAETAAEQDAAVLIVDQEESLATDADAMAAASGVPDAADQSDAGNAAKEAKKPEKTGKQAEASIPSGNPDDANKHPAWRKREADKAKGDLQTLRRSLMQQEGK